MNYNQDYLSLLIKIQRRGQYTQRELANAPDPSLWKLNYCLNELKKKCLIKINNFRNNKNKLGYIYILTAQGISEKTKLTVNFMKRKMKEYDELKKELKE